MADDPPSLWKDTPDDEWETLTPNEDPKQTEVDNQSKQEQIQPPKNGTCLSQDTQEQEPQWEIPKKQRQSRKPNNKKTEIKIQTENKFSELDSDSEWTSEQKIKKRRHSAGNTQVEADIAYEEEFGHNKMDSTDDATSSENSIIGTDENYFDASEDEEKVNID